MARRPDTGKFIDTTEFLTILASHGVDFLLSSSSKGNGKVPLSSISLGVGHSVFLYFSANWCRPCQTFTPHLLHLYHSLRSSGKHIEIILVSLDTDLHAFHQHLNSMPWLALPFSFLPKLALTNTFKVERIPSLIPLTNSDGILFQQQLIELIQDYGAQAFPFTPTRRDELKALDDSMRRAPKLQQLLNYVISRDHKQVLVSELAKKKTVALYFGAQWSPPCRNFNAQLIQVYEEVKTTRDEDFEIVFVSTDRDQQEFEVNLSSMPWLGVPYEDTRTRQDLCRIFNIKAIPALVVIGATDGKTITTKAKDLIRVYGAKAFPFTESRIEDIKAKLKKQGEALPAQVKDARHQHVLKLEMVKAFICDSCKQHGRFWAFSCHMCDYDLHPTCVQQSSLFCL